MAYITIPIHSVREAGESVGEAWSEVKELSKLMAAAKAKVLSEYLATPEGGALSRMSSFVSLNDKMDGIEAYVDEGFSYTKPTVERVNNPTKHIDPKTMNTLLSGKLLTDAQKRALITEHLGVDLKSKDSL